MQCRDVMQRRSTISTLAELHYSIHNVDIDLYSCYILRALEDCGWEMLAATLNTKYASTKFTHLTNDLRGSDDEELHFP